MPYDLLSVCCDLALSHPLGSWFRAEWNSFRNMKVWFLNMKELFEDRLEVIPGGRAECARDIFPASKSGSNSITCPSSFSISISHLLDYSDLLHEQAGSFSGQTSSCARDTKILAGAAPTNDIYRGKQRPVQLCNIANVEHMRRLLSAVHQTSAIFLPDVFLQENQETMHPCTLYQDSLVRLRTAPITFLFFCRWFV